MKDAKQLVENIPPEIAERLRRQILGLLAENVGPYDANAATEYLIALLIRWGNTTIGLDEMLTREQTRQGEGSIPPEASTTQVRHT
jgi:hypothetical protein